jgi:hypothetical protein
MSRQRPQLDSWNHERVHREKRIKKIEKIHGLQALLEMWEPMENDSDTIHDYVLELRRKLRCAENQFAAMKI